MGLYKRKITVDDQAITSAVNLTLRQSLLPNLLGMLECFTLQLNTGLTGCHPQSQFCSSFGDSRMVCWIL